MGIFGGPIIVSVVALVGVFVWGGTAALSLAFLLSVLEITLSFDNAVVNAKVLERMSRVWQQRFLTWGIFIAVFGTRLLLPAIIVGFAAGVSPLTAATLAFQDPEEYARLLETASHAISAFGGIFLIMVALNYFFDTGKNVHWITSVERRVAGLGRIEAIEIALTLALLIPLSYFAAAPQASILVAGCIGLLVFVVMQGLTSMLDLHAKDVTRTGVILFVYLNILDAAFSLDGVVAAFAITTEIPVIFVGLGIGAYFVRAITLYMVRRKTLATLRYLEHGAHWAILGLGISMLVGVVFHVPEMITAFIGLFFVALSYRSSRREQARQ